MTNSEYQLMVLMSASGLTHQLLQVALVAAKQMAGIRLYEVKWNYGHRQDQREQHFMHLAVVALL